MIEIPSTFVYRVPGAGTWYTLYRIYSYTRDSREAVMKKRYAIRQRYSDRGCVGPAAVAEALELGVCQSWATHDLSIMFVVEAGHFFTREYMNRRCVGKPSRQSKSPIEKKCSQSNDEIDGGAKTYYFNWAFADELPAVSLGYPYMQTNYTSSRVCNMSTFSTVILFHADAAQRCVAAASLNFPTSKSLRLQPANSRSSFHPRFTKAESTNLGSTAFTVSYFSDKLCSTPSLIQDLICPSHCDTTMDDNGTFFTSSFCLAEAEVITANTAQLVWVSVSCFAIALGLGTMIFVWMRRRAHGVPLRGKEPWAEVGKSTQEYSTF